MTPEHKLEQDGLAFRLFRQGRRIEYSAMKCQTSVGTIYRQLGGRVQEARARVEKAGAPATAA